MIITVDPSQSEDIAAFAMVKQYRLQALNVTLNGGTGSGAWQAAQSGEGYTQTVVTPVTGIELVYEDPNAIVSYTVENDDTSNYDAASDAGIILSSIAPTDNAWTYTCVFHADSAPVSAIDIDLLVYGNVARGTEQSGSSATAEEITAQVLAGLETRVSALETEMPTKADVATTYTKTETDTLLASKADVATTLAGYGITDTYTKTEVQTYVSNALDSYAPMVRTANAQTIGGIKTASDRIVHSGQIMTPRAGEAGTWYMVAKMPKQAGAMSRSMTFMIDSHAYATGEWGMFIMTFGATSYLPNLKWVIKNPSWTSNTDIVAVTSDGAWWQIWLKVLHANNRTAISLFDLCTEVVNQTYNLTVIDPAEQTAVSTPTTDSSITYIS